MMHRWEEVTLSTDRMEVPGGWIYRTTIEPYGEEGASTVAMVFVPGLVQTPFTNLMQQD